MTGTCSRHAPCSPASRRRLIAHGMNPWIDVEVDPPPVNEIVEAGLKKPFVLMVTVPVAEPEPVGAK